MENYECEHGNPAQPGGHTACKECPDDPAQVKYRPTPRYHALTVSRLNLLELTRIDRELDGVEEEVRANGDFLTTFLLGECDKKRQRIAGARADIEKFIAKLEAT